MRCAVAKGAFPSAQAMASTLPRRVPEFLALKFQRALVHGFPEATDTSAKHRELREKLHQLVSRSNFRLDRGSLYGQMNVVRRETLVAGSHVRSP